MLKALPKPGDPNGGDTGLGTLWQEKREGIVTIVAPNQDFFASFHPMLQTPLGPWVPRWCWLTWGVLTGDSDIPPSSLRLDQCHQTSVLGD